MAFSDLRQYPASSYVPRDILGYGLQTPVNRANTMENFSRTGSWIGGSRQATEDYLNNGLAQYGSMIQKEPYGPAVGGNASLTNQLKGQQGLARGASQYGLPQSASVGPTGTQAAASQPVGGGGTTVGSAQAAGAAGTPTAPNSVTSRATAGSPRAKAVNPYPSASTWRPQQSAATTAQPGLRTPRPPSASPDSRYVDSSGGWGWDYGANGAVGANSQPYVPAYKRGAGVSVQEWKDGQTGGTTGGTGTSIGGGIQGGNLTNQDIGYATSFIGGAGQVPFEVSSDAQRELRQRSQDEGLQGTNRESLDLSRRGSFEQSQMDLARQMAEAESGLGYGNLLARLRDMDVSKNLTEQGYLYDLVGSVF